MIIETRYRDIPFEEAEKCQPHTATKAKDSNLWNRLRGTTVQIHVPSVSDHHPTVICGGPFFRRVTTERDAAIVCPHIAEIGD